MFPTFIPITVYENELPDGVLPQPEKQFVITVNLATVALIEWPDSWDPTTGVISSNGKRYAFDITEEANSTLFHILFDMSTPFVMIQPNKFVHRDHILSIGWQDAEWTRAKVRAAVPSEHSLIAEDVINRECIKQLRFLCRFGWRYEVVGLTLVKETAEAE